MGNFIKCSKCGNTIPKNAQKCRHCGVLLKSQEMSLPAIIFVGLVAVGTAYYFLGGGDNSPSSSPATTSTPAKPKTKRVKKPRPEVVVGEFATIRQCLTAANSAVGPLDIVRDRPDEIHGTTRDNQMFQCKQEVTGSRGTFFVGWYEVVRPNNSPNNSRKNTRQAVYTPNAITKVRGDCSAEEALNAFKAKHPDMPEPPASMTIQLPCPDDL